MHTTIHCARVRSVTTTRQYSTCIYSMYVYVDSSTKLQHYHFDFPFRCFSQIVKSLTSTPKWSLNINNHTYLSSLVIYKRFPFEKSFWIFQNFVTQLSILRFTWNSHQGKAHFRIYSEMPTMKLYSQSQRADSFRRISHRNRAHTKCREKRCRVMTFEIGTRKMIAKAAHALLLSP